MPLRRDLPRGTSRGRFTSRSNRCPGKKIRTGALLLLLFIPVTTLAAEREILKLSKLHLQKGEYYNAITEAMRYRYLYPDGAHIPESMLLTGKAYFLGKNYNQAGKLLYRCFDTYKDREEGEEALYTLAYMRMTTSSPFNANRLYQQYQYLYEKGRFRESVLADRCYTLALMNELNDAKNAISEYYTLYPNGRYSDNLNELAVLINTEAERPRKSIWVSLIGSIFLPGFGHFYTENYAAGVFSLGSNAALIYLIYDSYRDRDAFRLLFFTFLELSFYQYSIYSSIRNVQDYNSREEFYRNVKLGIRGKF